MPRRQALMEGWTEFYQIHAAFEAKELEISAVSSNSAIRRQSLKDHEKPC